MQQLNSQIARKISAALHKEQVEQMKLLTMQAEEFIKKHSKILL